MEAAEEEAQRGRLAASSVNGRLSTVNGQSRASPGWQRKNGEADLVTGAGSLGVELFEFVRWLDLPNGNYAIFGSGPLIVRGIVEASNDLDIICRGTAWDQVTRLGEVSTFPGDDNECVNLLDGRITFGTTWKYGVFDLDELIDTAEVIDGLPFVRLDHVIAYKQAADRAKDREHLTLLKDWSGG